MYKLVHNGIDREKILMTRQADKNYGKCYMDQYIIFFYLLASFCHLKCHSESGNRSLMVLTVS